MIQTIIDPVERLLDERGSPILVALDGRIGAGKSTLAAAVGAALQAAIVPGDDFFAAEITAEGWNGRSPAERVRDAIDWRRLRRTALEPLLAGKPAVWRPFDFGAGERADGTYPMSPSTVRRDPAPVIVLDGAYSTRAELADLVDLSILVEIPESLRLARLTARDSPAFLAAWHARWDVAEDYYFTHLRPPDSFDLVIDGS